MMKNIDEIISALYDGILQESETIEFKRTLPKDFPQMAKIIVGIANSGGGYLILGVTDQVKNGKMIIGIDNPEEILKILSRIITEYTIGVQGKPYLITVETKNIVVLEIKKTEIKAYYSRRKTSPERLIAYTRISHDGLKIKEIAREKKNYAIVYKYMTLEAFMISLYAKTWRFFEPNKWNDKYEQRFYCAKYTIDGADDTNREVAAYHGEA